METDERQRLHEIIEHLDPANRAMLLAFAEFLRERGPVPAPSATAPVPEGKPAVRKAIPEPEPIPAPENERVVAAIKRLSNTYPMLSKNKMLAVTSDLLSQHVVQGRDAAEVIAELERVFAEAYEKLKAGED